MMLRNGHHLISLTLLQLCAKPLLTLDTFTVLLKPCMIVCTMKLSENSWHISERVCMWRNMQRVIQIWTEWTVCSSTFAMTWISETEFICVVQNWVDAGLSLKSQELTAIFLMVRLYCSLVMEYDIHTLLDFMALATTVWVIYMMRFKLKATLMEELDNLPLYYVVSWLACTQTWNVCFLVELDWMSEIETSSFYISFNSSPCGMFA